jgi:hypothetical protein
MRFAPSFVLITLLLGDASAAELKISPSDPVVVSAPSGWAMGQESAPRGAFPFATVRITASGERNAVCMISVLDRARPEFKNREVLKRILRGDSRPYLTSATANVEIKELPISGGLGFYANFIDPDLVDKPIKKGSYKTATPLILSLGEAYLIKVTILCDDLQSRDYREALQIVKSARIVRLDE